MLVGACPQLAVSYSYICTSYYFIYKFLDCCMMFLYHSFTFDIGNNKNVYDSTSYYLHCL